MEIKCSVRTDDDNYKEALIRACGDYLIDPEYNTLENYIYERLGDDLGDIEMSKDELIKVTKDAKRFAIDLLISANAVS
jgi:hypothetical protein